MESNNTQELVKARIEFNKLILEESFIKDSQGQRSEFTSLEQIQTVTTKCMNQCGLFIDQHLDSENGNIYLITTLSHISDQYKRSKVFLYKEEWLTDMQKHTLMAGIKTYQQRYEWRALLGIGRGQEDGESSQESVEDSRYITKNQGFELYGMFKDHPKIKTQLFAYYGINHTDKLPADKFEEAKDIIQGLLEKKG
jgi:hypothetical protein